MELQKFISNTLVSIVNGLKDANDKINIEGGQRAFWIYPDKHKNIQFDVAVTVNEEDIKSGGAGIRIAVLDAGAKKEKINTHEYASRIKFEIGPNISLS